MAQAPVFGPIAELAGWVAARAATRVLVVTSSPRHLVQLTPALAGVAHDVFAGARVHVPAEVVAEATAALAGHDLIVAIGGGSAIGLGKALRLAHDVGFVAIPTTYAGSERTTIYGITHGATKQTGRDPRVAPDLVLYDVELTLSLPRALTTQSLVNALAHVVSALSTGSLSDDDRGAALRAAGEVVEAATILARAPADRAARARAQRGASACALAIEHGTPGAQHGLAHLLGGATGIDHAPLHAVLLPAFIGYVRARHPEIIDELERATGHAPLDAALRALLIAAGAPATLDALGITAPTVAAALATRPDLPGEIAHAAQR